MALHLILVESAGPKIVGVTYSVKNATVRGGREYYELAELTITFDQDLYLNGRLLNSYADEARPQPNVSATSNTLLCLSIDLCRPLPDLAEALLGTVNVVCDYSGAVSDGGGGMSGSSAIIRVPTRPGTAQLFSNWPVLGRLPTFFVPTYPAADAATAFFYSHGLVNLSTTPPRGGWAATSARQLSGVVFLVLANAAGEPRPMGALPTASLMRYCSVSLGATGLNATGGPVKTLPLLLRNATGGTGTGLTNAAGEAVLPDSSASLGVPTLPRALTCENGPLQVTMSQITRSIAVLRNLSDYNTLQSITWTIAGYTTSDPFYACLTTLRSMLSVELLRRWRNTTVCGEDPGSERWLADPCCNDAVGWTQCCYPRGISTATPHYLGTLTPLATCKATDKVAKYLADMLPILNSADNATSGCSATTEKNYNSTLYAGFAEYYTGCMDKIWTKNAKLTTLSISGYANDPGKYAAQPGCNTSADCYPNGTACVVVTGKSSYCATPAYDGDMDTAMFYCMIEEMPGMIRTYFQLDWGLNVTQPIADFAAAFRQRFFVEACWGGWGAWFLNFDFTGATPFFRPPDKQTCLNFTVCNPIGTDLITGNVYGRPVTNKTCPTVDALSGMTEFCGTSYRAGPLTRSFSALTWPSGCFDQLESTTSTKCKQGTYLSYMAACYLNSSWTREQCLPRSVCPQATWDAPRQSECMEKLCYSLDIPHDQCVNNATTWRTGDIVRVWRPTWANGTGLCVISGVDMAGCAKLTYKWNPGRFWYNNSFDSKPECDRGPCMMAPNTLFTTVNNVASCNLKSVCSAPCWNCWSRNAGTTDYKICYTRNETLLRCIETGGKWSQEFGVCSHSDFALNATGCRDNGWTHESCSTLSVDECRSCQGDGPCPVNQTIMKCGFPELGKTYSCRNSTDCVQNSGRCGQYNSIDFTNKNLTDAVCNFATADGWLNEPNCRGVCTTNYTFVSGRPACPDDPTGKRYNLGTDGCRDYKFGNRTTCESEPGHWWVVRPTGPTARQQCAAFGVNTTCWDPAKSLTPSKGLWTHKTPAVCDSCGYNIANTYDWVKGSFDTAEYYTRNWYKFGKRGPVRPNSWQPTLEWNQYRLELRNLAARRFAPFVQSELLCRYSPLLEAISTIACTCGAGGPEECFSGKQRPITVGTQRFCAGIADNVQMSSIQLAVSSNTVPQSLGCVDLTIGLVRAAEFAKSGVLSSQDLSLLSGGGPYGVVLNAFGVVVGQLRSDGAALTWEGSLAAPFNLCLEATVADAGDFDTIDFATLDAARGVTQFLPLSASVNSTPPFFCVDISKPGTYFVISRQDGDWTVVEETTLFPTYARVIFGIEAGLFALLSLAGIFSFALVVTDMMTAKDRSRRSKLTMPQTMLFLIAVFAAIRCVWLATVSSAAVTQILPWGQSILSEFPIYIMYSIFSTLIVLWMEATSFALQNRTLLPVAVINVVIYLYYIVLLITFTHVSPATQVSVAIAYRVGISVISLATVVLFWVVGVRMMRAMAPTKQQQQKKKHARLRLHVTIVISILSGALVLQVIFLLAGSTAATSGPSVQWPLTIVYYLIAELLPLAVLAHVLAGPIRTKFKRNSSKSSRTSSFPRAKSLASGGSYSVHGVQTSSGSSSHGSVGDSHSQL